MCNQPRFEALIVTIIKPALKKIYFPLFYEVVKYPDGFRAGGQAQQLNASFGEGPTNEGAMKFQSSPRAESPFLTFFFPSRLMQPAHFLKQLLGPGKLRGRF